MRSRCRVAQVAAEHSVSTAIELWLRWPAGHGLPSSPAVINGNKRSFRTAAEGAVTGDSEGMPVRGSCPDSRRHVRNPAKLGQHPRLDNAEQPARRACQLARHSSSSWTFEL